MKKALVLAGGGTRGSYQNGALHALRRLGHGEFDIVTGTSIGALNAAMVVQKDYRAMDRLWHTLTQDKIMNGALSVDMDISDMISGRSQLVSFAKDFIKERGADIAPLKAYIHELYNEKRFFESDVDFGCMVCRRDHSPVYVTKEMMKEDAEDWLIATASAYPAFPVHKFKDNEYIDGGYYDNLPIDFALRLGAQEIVAVDLTNEPKHPNFMDRTGITYIFPQVETTSFLSFDRETLDRLETLGYYDTMKAFGTFDGVKYTFESMNLPEWYYSFLHETLLMEGKIHAASEISNRFFSRQAITDHIASQQHVKVVSDKRMFFGFLDNLMSICGLSVERVWTYKEARNAVLAQFAPCADVNYEYWPESYRTDRLLAYASTLGTKGITEKMVHAELYPDHKLVSDNVWYTVYPFEKALARFVMYLMNELKGE